jgi:hypothetical protein
LLGLQQRDLAEVIDALRNALLTNVVCEFDARACGKSRQRCGRAGVKPERVIGIVEPANLE